MLKVGSSYRTESGRKFNIIGKKVVPDRRGFNYIGEASDSGVVTFFNDAGINIMQSNLNLKVDKYKWIIIISSPNGKGLAHPLFERREDLDATLLSAAVGFLRIENGALDSVTYVPLAGFKKHYA